MAKSSIHFRPVLATSEAHNLRKVSLDYNCPELEKNNDSLILQSIDDRLKEIKRRCKEISGRKLQKNSEPIKEAVLNILPSTTINDLKTLSEALKMHFGIEAFQFHIHRDEGHVDASGEFQINQHAHMLFDWQDKAKGTTVKLNRTHLSQIQTLTAEILGMERGELRVNSNRERLEPIEYKREKLQLQVEDLEQKKNTVRARIERIEGEGTEALPDEIRELIDSNSLDFTKLSQLSENQLNSAIHAIEAKINAIESEINR